jgi:hypothetical protein
MKKLAFALLLGCAAGAAAQERASQFAHSGAITLEGSESHYRFPLPAAAYMGIARRDLGDVRVFNAAGEAVPYGFVPLRAKTIAPESRGSKLFPLYGEEAKGLDGVDMRLEQSARGTIVHISPPASSRRAPRKLLGYLLDTGEEKEKPLFAALNLEWAAREPFTGFARVEASDDLKRWALLVDGAPVLLLEHEGARLERKRIELAGANARYLRLSFTGVPPGFALKQVSLELRPDSTQPERDWLGTPGTPDPRRPGEYAFDTGGHFPVDRMRFALPQPNTVAHAQLFARDRLEEPWQPIAAATLYRLRRDSRDLVNSDVAVPPDGRRYWLLKVDQRGGGLGAGELRLEFGWIPHELVFAARGAAPFNLAYGMKTAKPGALPLATIVPGYKSGDPIPAKMAAVSVLAPTARERASLFGDPAAFVKAAVDSGEAKIWALWASLVAGVLVLGWMAFRLLHQVGQNAGDRNPE